MTLVRVRDDGHGMSRADAELALERHATSKLRALDDLQRIATHGFRGEALPSIASVSELVLRTRAEGEPAGTEVEVAHGRRRHVRDAGHPRGTTVEVRDLFGALPARRKFLRSAVDRGLARGGGAHAAGARAARDGLLAQVRRAGALRDAAGGRARPRASSSSSARSCSRTSCPSRAARSGWRCGASCRGPTARGRRGRSCASS